MKFIFKKQKQGIWARNISFFSDLREGERHIFVLKYIKILNYHVRHDRSLR